MKKRIIAAFVCTVIVALSVLTAFSGCSGESYPKLVADRDEFFSKVAGRYGDSYFNMYVFEDGTFQENYSLAEGGLLNFIGSFKTVYQDSEFIYHTEISKLNKSIYVSVSESDKPKFTYGNDINYEKVILGFPGFFSNEIIHIFAPGMPVSEIPLKYLYSENTDTDADGKLDKYLFVNYSKTYEISRYIENNYINNGVWVDYNPSDSTIDVYSFDYYDVNVTTYDLSENKLTQIEDSKDKLKPIYYATFGSCIIVFYDNGKANVIWPTEDKNKKKYYVDATDSLSRTPHKLVHYDKLPDYNTIIKEKSME